MEDFFAIHVFKPDSQWVAYDDGPGWTGERGYGKTPRDAALDLCRKCEEFHFQMECFAQIAKPTEEGSVAFQVPFKRDVESIPSPSAN